MCLDNRSFTTCWAVYSYFTFISPMRDFLRLATIASALEKILKDLPSSGSKRGWTVEKRYLIINNFAFKKFGGSLNFGDVMESPAMTVSAIISSLLRNVSCSRYRILRAFLGKGRIGSVICSSWKYRMCFIPDRCLGMAAAKAASSLWFFRETSYDGLFFEWITKSEIFIWSVWE